MSLEVFFFKKKEFKKKRVKKKRVNVERNYPRSVGFLGAKRSRDGLTWSRCSVLADRPECLCQNCSRHCV